MRGIAYPDMVPSIYNLPTSRHQQISEMAGMANAATKEIRSPKSEEKVAAEDVLRSREPWHGFDGADARDDPYANLRYAFKTDSLKGRGRVSISKGVSGEAARQSEQMPSIGPKEPTNPMQLPVRVLPAQDAQSTSQGPSEGQEGLHLSEYSDVTFPSGQS
jgi:hypothetical protein